VQALERAAPTLPMRPGRAERREYEYIRHGTLTLIAAFDVVTGGGCQGSCRFNPFAHNLIGLAAQTHIRGLATLAAWTVGSVKRGRIRDGPRYCAEQSGNSTGPAEF
jgi:hypothetical protein